MGITLPRTPVVFDEKTKWSLDGLDGDPDREVENYRSTKGFEERIEALFQEEEKLGWMLELEEEEAKKRYGDNLYLAGLGVVEEKDKVRVVHDGTHGVGVNNRIKVLDQVKSPTAGEIRALMREKHEMNSGNKQFLLMGDVSKAHRRVKVRKQDWGFQACRLRPGKVWLNCVGTYGIASAGYWWGALGRRTAGPPFLLLDQRQRRSGHAPPFGRLPHDSRKEA